MLWLCGNTSVFLINNNKNGITQKNNEQMSIFLHKYSMNHNSSWVVLKLWFYKSHSCSFPPVSNVCMVRRVVADCHVKN